jgi:molecular chaperone HtpG
MAEVHDTSVALDGLLQVLGEHLYSTPKVALRELVQNAHDSVTRRGLESPDPFEPRIEVRGDDNAGTITITDTGAGLTVTEIHEFLATIGAGYTRELRAATAEDSLIGQFGLGFLSAFVVAQEVSVATTSFRSPGERWQYVSRGGLTYTVEQCPAGDIGTTVTLVLKDQFRTLLDEEVLADTLRRYCTLLRHPIFLSGADTAINATPPPWRAPGATTDDRAAAEMAFADRFDPTFGPLCTLPVKASGNSDVVGLLWVQDGGTYGSSDNRAMSVFVRGMLLDDDASDLLPRWAGFVGGVVESTALTPTASREDLQRNPAYDAAQAAISEALIDGLARIARTRPEVWRRVMRRHSEAMLGAALVDDRLFEVIAPVVQIPTTAGDVPPEALVRDSKVYVSLEVTPGFEEMIFRAISTPVARGVRYGVLPFLRRWCLSLGYSLVEVGTADGDRAMFRSTDLDEEAARWLQRSLADNGEEVVPARFLPEELPLVRVVDRDVELRDRLYADDTDARISSTALALARLYADRVAGAPAARVYVNLDNPAVAAVVAARLMENPLADEGAMVLRALKHVLGGTGDLAQSLGVLNAVVERIVGGA